MRSASKIRIILAWISFSFFENNFNLNTKMIFDLMLLSFCSNLILTNINKLRITRERNNEKNFWIKHTQVNVHSFLDISIVLQLKRHDGRHNSGKRIRVRCLHDTNVSRQLLVVTHANYQQKKFNATQKSLR